MPPSLNTGYQYISPFVGGQKQANAVKPFESVLPYQQFLSGLNLQGLAESRINPLEQASANQQVGSYYNTGNSNGSNRFGSFQSGLGKLQGDLTEHKNERIGNFVNPLQEYFTKMYSNLSDMYYKDPNLDTMKTMPQAAPLNLYK